MPAFAFNPTPPTLTQAELDTLAAEQAQMQQQAPPPGLGGVGCQVQPPPPQGALAAPQTTMPSGPPPAYVAGTPPAQAPVVDYTVSGGNESPSPTPSSQPYAAPTLGATQTTMPTSPA
jgi:hypothetical protein